jgi:hypothetical protein
MENMICDIPTDILLITAAKLFLMLSTFVMARIAIRLLFKVERDMSRRGFYKE